MKEDVDFILEILSLNMKEDLDFCLYFIKQMSLILFIIHLKESKMFII